MRNDKLIVFRDFVSLANKVVDHLNKKTYELAADNFFTIALSGGSTPKNLFSVISENYSDKINWDKIKIFWGDERSVDPNNEQSNYNMTYNYLLKYIDIPEENIFRIHGEANPEEEAKRYSKIIENELKVINGIPSFDLVMLGLGEDGHTASIFPDQLNQFFSDSYCVVTFHPESKQKRISITGKIINNAKEVVFLVTGKSKSIKIYEIINDKENAKNYPAYFVKPVSGKLMWLVDDEAASMIDKSKINLTI